MCRYTSIYLHSKHVEQILYCMNWGPDGRQHIFLQAKLKFLAGYSKSALCKCDLWLSQPFQRTSSLRGRFLPSPCCRVQNPPAGGSFSNGENYQWSTAKLRLFASLGSTIKLQSKEIHVETKPPLRTVFPEEWGARGTVLFFCPGGIQSFSLIAQPLTVPGSVGSKTAALQGSQPPTKYM